MTHKKWGEPITAKVMKSLNLPGDTPVRAARRIGETPVVKPYSRWKYHVDDWAYQLPADHDYYKVRYETTVFGIPTSDIGKIINAVRDGDIDEARKHLPVDPITLKARQICADVMRIKGYMDGNYDDAASMQVAKAALKEAGYEHND